MFKRIINNHFLYPIIVGLLISICFLGSCGNCNQDNGPAKLDLEEATTADITDDGNYNQDNGPAKLDLKETTSADITDEMIAAAKKFKAYGRTPFLEEVLQKLKNNEQVDINAKDPYGVRNNPSILPRGNTALHQAIQMEHAAIVAALLVRKADVNQVNDSGNTPLHNAVGRKNIEMLRLLLAQPTIDVNKKDKFGETSLHLAVWLENTEMVKQLLICPEIQVKITNDCRLTPLQLVSKIKNSERRSIIENLLRAKGATK